MILGVIDVITSKVYDNYEEILSRFDSEESLKTFEPSAEVGKTRVSKSLKKKKYKKKKKESKKSKIKKKTKI